jgi:transposase-like protein
MGVLGAWRPWAEVESVAETASRIGVTDQTIRNWAKERPHLLVERDGHTAVRRDEVLGHS